MVEHIQRVHRGDWECKLPGCEGSNSEFRYERFRTHLSDHHDIGNPLYNDVLTTAGISERGFSDLTFTTCKHCSEHRAKSDQIEVSRDETV
jgi:hypothetical protein